MATPLLQRVEAASANLTMTTFARLCKGLAADPRDLLAPAAAQHKKRGRGRPAGVPPKIVKAAQ